MKTSVKKESYLSEKYLPNYLDAYKVIIAGGRDFDDYEYMSTKLNELFKTRICLIIKRLRLSQEWQKGQILLVFVMQMNIN